MYGTHGLILRKVHGGSLAGHFGEEKTYMMAKEHYYWPHMLKDLKKLSRGAQLVTMSKSHSLPLRLVHSTTYPSRTLVRCKHGFCAMPSKNATQQGLHLDGGG